MTSPTAVPTFTGRQVDLLSPAAADIAIEDIAHGLAYSTRFNGQTKTPITIAQHCVMGSYFFDEPALALGFLLHDAAEAYMGDLVRPLRAALLQITHNLSGGYSSTSIIDIVETNLDEAIAEAFGMCRCTIHNAEIKRIDDILCAVEGGVGGLFPHIHSAAKLFNYRAPWGALQAEAEFLGRFEELQRQRTTNETVLALADEAIADLNHELSMAEATDGNG